MLRLEIKIIWNNSQGLNFHQNLMISRLPEPTIPRLGLASYLLADSFIAAVVSYATLMSMALILAKGEDYQVDANQELLAMVRNIH